MFYPTDLPEHISRLDISDEDIIITGCAPDAIIVPRLAELNNIDPVSLRATEFCDATTTFEEACSFDNTCSFITSEFRDESEACTDQVAGTFAFDCTSGKWQLSFLLFNNGTS